MLTRWRQVLTDRMVLRFALTSLVVIIAVGVLLALQLSAQLRERRLTEAHGRALVTGRMLQHEAKTGESGSLGRGGDAASSDLRARFERHLGPAGIPEAYIWSPDGRPLFATGDLRPGLHEHTNTHELQAILDAHEPSSAIVDIERDDPHHSVVGATFVTYLPITLGDGQAPDAVLELVQDYGPTAAAIGAGLRTVAISLAGGLLGLYVLLLPIVAGASSRLRRLVADQDEHVRRLESAEQVKNTFLAAVSHEMRTPLTVISGMLILLRERGSQFSPKRRHQMVTRAHANSKKLEQLLEDLLDVDRLTRGVITARRESVDLERVVERTVDAFEPDLHPVEFHAEPCRIHADAAQVERIIENLLANAVKYTPPGTPVWVSVRDTDDGALLAVEDAGPGIPEDSRERIFEEFERAHNLDHAPGTGVGLALVQRFARMHDGEAWVDPRPGGGASFKVRLRDCDRSRPRVAPRSHTRPATSEASNERVHEGAQPVGASTAP